LDRSILVNKITYFNTKLKFQAVICFRVMTSSIVFLKWKPHIFFLDFDNPFNCLNAGIKILLPYIRKFLRKKKFGKNKFYNEQKQVKNCVSKYVLKIME
jgi:hypothetical protein